ncbi:phosphatidate phosphatase PAH2-like isoform X2 [Tasmannia lanceolata]|uniref:phosphatidate phosphatase PAH2-like isoform X2 n=1 Tax=Tasmannia lanceolata TaxID=3420 RepID=UPI004063644B
MHAMERLSSYISRGVYTVSCPFHPFGGAVDIIVVQQQDGSFKSSPWYVKFGKFPGVLKTKEKVVNICVNGTEASFHMYLDHKGEAYFLREVDTDDVASIFSPPSSGDEMYEQSQNVRLANSQSLSFDGNQSNSVSQIDIGNGKIVTRTNSRRSRMFGLVFGRKSMEKNRPRTGDRNVQRISSLERAEIAANLLEVKWSTNLSTINWKTDNGSMSAPEMPAEEADKDVNINDKQSLSTSSVQDITDHNVSMSIGSHNETMGDHSGIGIVDTQSSEGMASPNYPCLKTHEQVLEISTLETSDSAGTHEAKLEQLTGEINEVSDAESSCSDEIVKGSISETTVIDLQGPNLADVEVGPVDHSSVFKQSGAALASDKRDGLVTAGVSTEESEESRVSSYIYCETSESSSVRIEFSSEHTLGTPGRTCEEVEVHTEVLYETTGLISEENSQTESVVLVGNESSDGCNHCVLEISKDQHPLEWHSFEEGSEREGISENPTTNSINFESSSIDGGTVQTETFSSLDMHLINYNSVEAAVVGVNSSMLSAETLEEDQFLFTDTFNFVATGVHCEDAVEMCSHSMEDIEEEHVSTDINHEFSFSSLPEQSRTQTSLISIPTVPTHLMGVDQVFRSLPSTQSHIYDLQKSDIIQPLSRSMDLSSEKSKRGMLRKDFSSNLKSRWAFERNIVADQTPSEAAAAVVDTQSTEEREHSSTFPAVEISLCRHLLFEGMGSQAASQVFDFEKVDLDKFTALGPSVLKNDRLVVRIGGRYLPWDSATPAILGMVSYGEDEIFEPEGSIAVDKVGTTLQGELSGAIVTSGGSWRLWPFSFRKSKGVKYILSAPHGTKMMDADNTSKGASDITGYKNMPKTRATKMVRSLVPTSEQLASLNLKDGRNVITFTFSTAVLETRQEDARIYLWKWNTRIVVSDVDGTITKSDVLGQFMPLVGKDWSQTGVAHLFSAIKENGFQLLFLSARAIAQANLTRHFLFNLKQDGKALPDGPVVISPDGLFPSLFREVIRRAPHEFKIACLEDIRALFPPDCNPFYAGFGNRDTDEISYLKGEVVVNRRVDRKSYNSLHSLVNGMFPAMTSAEQEDFNSWNYWKMPLPDISDCS